MIFYVMPCNNVTGWGVCATNLCKHLNLLNPIKYVSDEVMDDRVSKHPLEREYFKSLYFDDFDYLRSQKKFPVIQALQHDLSKYLGDISGSITVGICFSDRNIPDCFAAPAKKFDYLISGSNWCKELLLANKIESEVVYQGINPSMFNSSRSKKLLFENEFVVFSGGKFESRKGQDSFVKAYKVFQDRHDDVRLVTSWFNSYLNESGLSLLIDNKIDMSRVIMLPSLSNESLPAVYQNTDVGVFPSRCEAGTNLVMTEYMACEKPAIATVGTGQGDLVNNKTGYPIKSLGQCLLYENDQVVGIWEEPDPESILENLELVYNNKKESQKRAKAGAKLVSKLTWQFMAENLIDLINKKSPLK